MGSWSPLSVGSKASLGAEGKISPEGVGGQWKALSLRNLTPPMSETTELPKPAVANRNPTPPSALTVSFHVCHRNTGLTSSLLHFCKCEPPRLGPPWCLALISMWLTRWPSPTQSFMPLQLLEALLCAFYDPEVVITKFPVSSFTSLSISFIVCSKRT